jgi:hypothetical protein
MVFNEEEEVTGLFYRVNRSGLWCLMKRKKPQVCLLRYMSHDFCISTYPCIHMEEELPWSLLQLDGS